MKTKIILCDSKIDLVDAWKKEFENLPEFEILQGNIFELNYDALVSPGNSFGFMDGGIDLLISEFYGWKIQEKLQQIIKDKYNGELLVGQAELVETNEHDCKWILCAPTMRVPLVITNTVNVYLAAKGIFKILKEHPEIQTIAIPGLGTGVGRLQPHLCAKQMRRAYKEVFEQSTFPNTWQESQNDHFINLLS